MRRDGLRIGIDARFLTHAQPGGFKTYTEGLVEGLRLVDDVNSYFLYIDRPPSAGQLPSAANFTYRVVQSRLPVLGMPAREQIALPRRMMADRLDVLHFLCSTAPLKLPPKSVITLHDTIQLAEPQLCVYGTGLARHRRRVMLGYSSWVIRRIARLASCLITPSLYERELISRYLGISLRRIHVTPEAPTRRLVRWSTGEKEKGRTKAEGWGVRGRFVLGVGYEPRKNIPLLIEAFARLARDQPALQLVVAAAEAQCRRVFQHLAREAGVGGQTLILGAISGDDLGVLFRLAEMFVFPSEREGFGLPPLEAMACGVPVVALRCSSTPEVLGDAALLLEEKNADVLAAAMSRVLVDHDLRATLIDKGLKRAAEFSWERCARQTIEVYREVAEDRCLR